MKARDALRVLAEVTEAQWGMVTSAQARARGVSPMNLTRLTEAGDLTRLAHGVYRDAGTPSEEHEQLRAAWLAVDPAKLAFDRLDERPRGAVVSGESAAGLHGIGDLRAMSSEFTTPTRKQTQRPDVRYRTRVLPDEDVVIRDGLPVTTRERTIADLVEDLQDLSIVADALRDAARQSRLDTDRLAELLAPLAGRNGHHKGDGHALFNELVQIAGIDLDTLATKMSAIPEFGELVAMRYAERQLENDTAPLQAAVDSMAARIAVEFPQEHSPRILEVLAEAVSASIEPTMREISTQNEATLAASGATDVATRVARAAQSRMAANMKALDWAALLQGTRQQ